MSGDARADVGAVAGAGGDAIAVVGLAGRFPGAASVEELWARLRAGVESICRFTAEEARAEGVPAERLDDPSWVLAGAVLDDADRFDAGLFGMSPREAALTDPQHRLFLECAWTALEDAGVAPGGDGGSGTGAGERVGVFAGAGQPGYLLDHVRPHLAAAGGPGDLASAYAVTLGNDKDFLATRVAYKLGLTGPAYTVGSACSTSLVAVCLAATALATGDCDLVIAGGVSLRLPQRAGYPFTEDGILSPDGRCRPFDAEARGTVPGSGVGAVVLARLDDALAAGYPVRAVLRGWAVNNDGSDKAGYTAPRAAGQAAAIREALALGAVDPSSVGYVEAHGTGTPLGDPIEVEALREAFAGPAGVGACALGSIKSNLGHLDAAAGIAGLIKAVLALERGAIPPTLHFRRPNPRLGLEGSPFVVADRLIPWPRGERPRRAGVSSFGIGGTNAHVVLEEAPVAGESRRPAPGPHLFVVSAAGGPARDRAATALAERLAARPGLEPADVARTLHRGRRALPHRLAVVAAGTAEAAATLAAGGGRSAVAEPGHRPVAFLFPGQGAQHPAMGRALYLREPVFRREIDRCREVLASVLDPDDLALVLPGGPAPADARAGERLAATDLAQPALVALEIALARTWEARGVLAETLLGHSVGELAAACLGGTFALDDVLRLAVERGRLMAAAAPGAMLAVPLGEAELRRELEPLGGAVELAAVNASDRTVASGPEAAIAELAARLAQRGVEGRRLRTSHAFHSRSMTRAAEAFGVLVDAVERRPPERPWLSNRTGAPVRPEDATSPVYWARQLREPVLFADAAAGLLAEPRRVLLEVGPGGSLTALVRRHPQAAGRPLVASLPPPGRGDELATFLGAAGDLWLAGVEPARLDLDAGEGRRVRLPTYPFEPERHWIERGVDLRGLPLGGRREETDRAREPAAAAHGQVARNPDPADWFYLPTWQATLPAGLDPAGSGAEPAGLGAPEGVAGAASGTWLLVGDGAGLAARLAVELRGRGAAIRRVTFGDGFAAAGEDAWTVRPGDDGDARALLDALGSEPPGRVVWLVPVRDAAAGSGSGPADRGNGASAVEAAAAQAAALAAFARALSAAGGDGVTLAAVSDGLYDVDGREPPRAPERAASAGLLRVLPQELAGLACRWIDVAPAEALDEAAVAALADELAAGRPPAEPSVDPPPPSPPPLVALRGGRRWRRVYEPARVPPERAAASFRDGGRYLLTGGAGRFATVLAEHLVRRHRARLALLDVRDPGEADAAAVAGAVAAAGGEAEVRRLVGDPVDPEALSRAVSLAADRWGGLDGVIHAAGRAGDAARPVAELDAEELAAHLAPKLGGVADLAAALEGAPAGADRPAFVLATSSLAPVLGGVGLGAFAAADAAMDAWVAAGPGREGGGTRWTSVDWEVWGQAFVGSAAVLGAEQNALALGVDDLVESCRRAVALAGVPCIAVSTGDLAARVAEWTGPARRRRPPASGEIDRDAPYRAPGDPVEARIAAVWQEVLGVGRVGLDDDFFLLGGDSLTGLQVLSKLRTELAVELPLGSFFEARTVAGMAEVVAAERARGAEEERRMAELLAEVESLAESEVAELLAEEGAS